MSGIETVVSYETGRIALEKTEEIETGEDGSITWDRDFPGSGYVEKAEKDMNRIMNQMAEERAIPAYEEELSEELQGEVDKIRFGHAHRGVKMKINRMSYIPERMMKSYREVSPPLLLVSKRLQNQVLQLLKDQREGGKFDGLRFGKRFNSRRVIQKECLLL